MAESSGTSTAETYELLVPETCQRILPVNAVRDEYTISRFVELSIKPDGGGSERKAVIPRDVVMPGVVEVYARSYPNATLTDMKGGLALVEEWNRPIVPEAAPPEPPLAQPVFVSDIDELIASRTMELNGRKAKVELDRGAIASLLNMGAAVVWVESDDGRSLASITTGAASNGSQRGRAVAVPDLSGFLELPRVVTPEGTVEPVPLSAANVAELRETGTTQAAVGASSSPVTFDVEAAAAAIRGGMGTVFEPPLPVFEAAMLAKAFPAFELCLYLPFRQRWELLGYSRGALLNSLSLAPRKRPRSRSSAGTARSGARSERRRQKSR